MSESERIIFDNFALYVLEIFKRAVKVIDFTSRGTISLPTGSNLIDVLGYSLTILREICAMDRACYSEKKGSVDVVD